MELLRNGATSNIAPATGPECRKSRTTAARIASSAGSVTQPASLWSARCCSDFTTTQDCLTTLDLPPVLNRANAPQLRKKWKQSSSHQDSPDALQAGRAA